MTERWSIMSVAVTTEPGVVAARQRARRIAELIGFDTQDQTRIATATSEMARNAFEYGSGGTASFALETSDNRQVLVITLYDKGPGIADLDAVLEGRAVSSTGMGIGIPGARRLMDRFRIESAPGNGTTVELAKTLPAGKPPISRAALSALAAELVREGARSDPMAQIAEQNRELERILDELERRQEELTRLSRELEDTNRGVVALYAELDEKAEQLRQASEMKTRFLSNMSHEFRTPVNSILALSHLLLDRVDGALTEEQERQVGFIRQSADNLAELVNDLLDIAKVEAGKIEVRPKRFTIAELFGTLRGSLKPLQTGREVELVFDPPDRLLPEFLSDEAKIAQILRNFISNALKFTERGEVRVRARFDKARACVLLDVSDTGIGIAPEDQARIFEEFEQVASPIQRKVKGTGLGLPLSRKLAELLHGEVWVRSEVGRGSTFTLAIPPIYPGASSDEGGTAFPSRIAAENPSVLIVDDDPLFRYALGEFIRASEPGLAIHEAVDGVDALARVNDLRPGVIVLDLQMPRLDGFAVLAELSQGEATRDIPVVIASSVSLDDAQRQRLEGATVILSKAELSRERVEAALRLVLAGSR